MFQAGVEDIRLQVSDDMSNRELFDDKSPMTVSKRELLDDKSTITVSNRELFDAKALAVADKMLEFEFTSGEGQRRAMRS